VIEARWIKAKAYSNKTILFCHELGANLNAWHRYGESLLEDGFNVFTFTFSPMPTKQIGKRLLTTGQWVTRADRDDVLAAIKYLKRYYPEESKKIGVLGISKGANAAIAALDHTRHIDAVVTDGAFSTDETIMEYIEKWGPMYLKGDWLCNATPRWVFRLMVKGSLWASSCRLGCWFLSVEKALRKTNVPIMFIHGESDSHISPRQANYLFSITHSNEELWIVPEAHHNNGVAVKPDEYREKIKSFFKEKIYA